MKKVFKWLGIVLGSLIGVILLTVIALFLIGNASLTRKYDFASSNLTLPTDAASIEFGKHRVETLCQGCHGADLGGIVNWFNDPALGSIDTANLTSGEGGIGNDFTVEDFVRAIRHGIRPNGEPLFMPAVASTAYLSNEDLAAIIAYVKTVPPVDRVTRGKNFTPLAKILYAAGVLPKLPVEYVSHDVQVTAPERGATAAYGEYLVNTNDCRICHGPQLNGAKSPDPTKTWVSPNLTPGGELGFWTEEQFIQTLRTGVMPSGRQMSDEMPWKEYRNFYDEELRAIWLYLQSLPKLSQFTK